MFNIKDIYYYHGNPSTFSWLSLVAIIISCFSIFFTLYYIYLTKRIELSKSKFEKFCIVSLDKAFENLDTIFKNSTYINIYKQDITNGFLDIQLLLISLKKVYKKIPLEQIILMIENFTDIVYKSDSNLKTDELKSDYLDTRILIYNEFFNFAIQKELVLFKRKKK